MDIERNTQRTLVVVDRHAHLSSESTSVKKLENAEKL